MHTIVVSGAIANRQGKGGEAWHRLSWVLGLKRLGFRVVFVEQMVPQGCTDRTGAVTNFENSVQRTYFREVLGRFDCLESATLIYGDGEQLDGLSRDALFEVSRDAALLVNISGHLTWPALKNCFRKTAYIDEDPGFTQLWLADSGAGFRLEPHDYYFTIGENIGKATCSIPTGGINWRPIRPLVVLDQWPVCRAPGPLRLTTVAGWRGPFGPIYLGGKTYGLKVHEFRKYMELPTRAQGIFELALDIHPADEKDRAQLLSHGWQIVDPLAVTGEPDTFRRYLQTSGAEFSVAKGIYVETHSGWFSDRTTRYLASGKPALVQDTGFRDNLPTGTGLVSFSTLEEAAAGAASIANDYDRHCQAARALAEEYFDSDKVLKGFLDEVGVPLE